MRLKNRFFWIVAFIGLLLDQLTKYWIVQNFDLGETIPILPGIFHLTYIRNDGAALGLFSGNAEWFRWVSLAASLGLITLGLGWFGRLQNLEKIAWGLILAGALGNGIDRFVAGSVVDFLDFQRIYFPWLFNLADVFINIGIVCLLIASFHKAPMST